jgi:hypothetical protein
MDVPPSRFLVPRTAVNFSQVIFLRQYVPHLTAIAHHFTLSTDFQIPLLSGLRLRIKGEPVDGDTKNNAYC